MFDIMEHNVSLVENLEKGRQPFKDMDAVYFITPTKKCVKHVLGDFVSNDRASQLLETEGKTVVPVTRYGKVHLIFSGPVGKMFYSKVVKYFT